MAMLLKRKRSESELSSSSSAFSSPPRTGFSQFPPMDLDSTPQRMGMSRNTTPSHLNSRTMKRFRGSRPSDEEVHQRTLNLLFSAQKQQHSSPPADQQPQHQPVLAQPVTSQQNHHHNSQASLHKFWSLPSPDASSISSAVSLPSPDYPIDTPTMCEDCGQALSGDASGDDAMDIDGLDAEVDTGCADCGKHVCEHCSINAVGERRRCLNCAGKRAGVGGLEWTGSGVATSDGSWRQSWGCSGFVSDVY